MPGTTCEMSCELQCSPKSVGSSRFKLQDIVVHNDILAKEVSIKISLHQNKFKQEQLFQGPLKILPETLASQM